MFDGNNHVISNLYINDDHGWLGLFRRLLGNAEIRRVGLENVNITNTTDQDHQGALRVGGLAGQSNGGTIIGCYVTGSVSSSSNRVGGLLGENVRAGAGTIAASYSTATVTGRSIVGGLVGALWGGEILASYSTGTVDATHTLKDDLGGLVGATGKGAGNITASYAAGVVSTANGGINVAGLVGLLQPPDGASLTNPASFSGRITDSYFDSEATGMSQGIGNLNPNASNLFVPAKTTAQLQSPTRYDGIYDSWNVDVDGETGNDDPWDFGGSSDYPKLQYGGMDTDIQHPGQQDAATVSLDVDGNGEAEGYADGLLIVRYLLGIPGTNLISGVIGEGATRTTADAIVGYLDGLPDGSLDVDGNGEAEGYADGLLIVRHLLGIPGTNLTSGVIGDGATRTTPAAIIEYIETLTGTGGG